MTPVGSMLRLGSGHLCRGERVEVGMDLEWATWGKQEEWVAYVCAILREMEETGSNSEARLGVHPY